MKKLLLLILLANITGCAINDNTDLKQWMKEQTSSMKGNIPPIPVVQTFQPVLFSGKDNPFEIKDVLSIKQLDKSKYQPDLNRRKTQLESFELSTLKLTGFINKDFKEYAIIKNPFGIVNYITIGDYIGTNYGRVINIEEGKILISESLQDSSAGWIKKDNSLEIE